MGLKSYYKSLKEDGFFHINRGMLSIKAAYFIFSLGMGMVFPYLTLQAYEIGMTYGDVSIIYGIIPFFTFFSSPISGLIGDLIGYKFLLIFNILLAGAASTCFDLVPRYYEEIKAPTTTLYVGSENAQISALQWPICHHSSTPDTCEMTPSFRNGFPGIEDYVDCEDSSYVIDSTYLFESATVISVENGTFCQTENSLLNTTIEGSFLECDVVKYRELEVCVHEVGSHSATFWSYFGLRWLYNWGMNSAYSLMDGTSVRMSEKFNSDYSTVMFWAMMGSTISPFIAGEVIKDPEEGSDEEIDYQLAFYIMDGFLLLSCLICLKLEVSFQRSDDKVWVALKKLMTPTSLTFFVLVFVAGIQWGVKDSYLSLYLQEDLGADSAFISYFSAIGYASVTLMSLVARPIIKKFKPINILVFGLWVECARELIYAFVDQSPPWYALGLTTLDSVQWGLGWIACVYYGNSITHPDLEATMVATIGSVEYIIAKGLASLIGGQVIDHTSWETPELFKCVAAVTFGVSLVTIVFYYIFIKEQHEKPQMEARKEVLRRIEEKKMRKAEARLEEGEDENNENNVRKRHKMKKVDSIMEAAKEGYMTGHNNLYPIAMRRQESGLSSDGSEGNLDKVDHPTEFAIGESSLRHKSIEEEEEEESEEGTHNKAFDSKE